MYITLQYKAIEMEKLHALLAYWRWLWGNAYLQIPQSWKKKRRIERKVVDNDPLFIPIGTGFFSKKKRGEQANLPSKLHKTREKRQTDIRHLLTPNRKPLTVLSHNTTHKQLTTLHTHQTCQNCAMVIWFKKG